MSESNELRSLATTLDDIARRIEAIERSLLAAKQEGPAQPLRQAGALARAMTRELGESIRRLEQGAPHQ